MSTVATLVKNSTVKLTILFAVSLHIEPTDSMVGLVTCTFIDIETDWNSLMNGSIDAILNCTYRWMTSDLYG